MFPSPKSRLEIFSSRLSAASELSGWPGSGINSVMPLCPTRAAILDVCDPPTKISLPPPSPAVGRPMPRLVSGFSGRLRQWRTLSSFSRESVMTSSVSKDKGTMDGGWALQGHQSWF